MEPRFVNRYHRTRDVYREIYQYVCFTRPVVLIFDWLFLLYAAIELVQHALGHESGFTAAMVYIAIWNAIKLFIYLRSVKLATRREAEAGGGLPSECVMSVTDTYIEQVRLCADNTSGVFRLEYANIKKIIQTRHLILLQTPAKQLLIFHKACFTLGTEAEFKAFLKSLGFKIK